MIKMKPHWVETKNKAAIFLREAKLSDAKTVRDFYNQTAKSSPYILQTPSEKKKTVKEERSYIKSHNDSKNSLLIIAFDGNLMVGMLGFSGAKREKMIHMGFMAMMLHPDYRSQGLGAILLKEMIKWARQKTKLVRLELGMMKSNKIAFKLYKKTGFQVEGCKKKAFRQPQGRFEDEYIMAYLIKR